MARADDIGRLPEKAPHHGPQTGTRDASGAFLVEPGDHGGFRITPRGRDRQAQLRKMEIKRLRAIGGTTTLPGWPPLADHLQPSWSSQFRSSKFSGSPSRDRAIFMR
jgi:hypothetical protein